MSRSTASPRQNCGRFSFEPSDDVLNRLRHISQDWSHWRVLQKSGGIESYLSLKHEIEVNLAVCGIGQQVHLIFRAIPNGRVKGDTFCGRENAVFDAVAGDANSQGDFVFVGAGYSAECAQQVVAANMPVPSRVWLETPQDGVEFGGDVFALPGFLGGKHVVHVVGGLAEGEVSVLALELPKLTGASEHGLVKRIPEVLDCVRSDAPKLPWQGLRKSDFENILSYFRVELFDEGVGLVILDKPLSAELEIRSLRLRPCS